MPILPLFSMPPAAQPLNSGQLASNKLSQQHTDTDSSPMLNIQANALNVGAELGQAAQTANPFMQSLMAAFTLPQGQGMAALNGETELAIEDINPDMALVTDIQDQYVDPLLSPWQIGNQEFTSNAELKFNLEQINQQRNANPEVNQSVGVLTPNVQGVIEGRSQSQLQTAQGSTLDPFNADIERAAIGVNPQLLSNKPGYFTEELAKNSTNLTENAIDSVDDFSVLNDDINIHEKPLTLMPSKPETAMTNVIDEAVSNEFDGAGGEDALLNMGMTEDKKIKQMAELTERKLESELTPKNFKLDVPPNDSKWTEQIAKRISIMSSEQLQTARIQLDPPELGSLDVKIRIHHEQMSVAFSSNQPQVREALESQAPRLREMMEQQGMNLVDVNVSSQQQGGGSGSGEAGQADDIYLGDDPEMEITSEIQLETDSLVDYFA